MLRKSAISLYECYIDNFHIDNHYTVTVAEKELWIDSSCLEQAKTLAQDIVYRNDFAYQTEDRDEISKLTPAQYQNMINDPEVPERIRKALKLNDEYWETYWMSLSEVAHQIVDEYTKGVSK